MERLSFWNRPVYTLAVYFILVLYHSLSTTDAECVWTVTMSTEHDDPSCPEHCHCTPIQNTGGMSVNCNKKGLSEVPKLPVNTVQLSLDENKISSLSRRDFEGCFKLRRISINSNGLKSIDDETFVDTGGLSELHLNNNELNINSSTSGFLDYLQNISTLSVSSNVYIDDAVFAKLPKLSELALNRTGTVSFEKSFLSMTMLKTITICGEFYRLGNDSFENLRNSPVEELTVISDKTLNEAEPLTFASLNHLRSLDLSSNTGLGFDTISRAWYGLQYTNITTLKLAYITPLTGPSVINSEFYNYLNLTNITTLQLSRNDICIINCCLSAALPNLQNLNLSFNRLSKVDNLAMDLLTMKELKNVDVSYTTQRVPYRKRSVKFESKFRNYNYSALGDFNLSNLRASAVELDCKCEAWKTCSVPPEPGDLLPNSDRNISELMQHQFSDIPYHGPWCIILPKKLKSINLTASINYNIGTLPQAEIFGKNRYFRKLVFRTNYIKKFCGPLIFVNLSSSLPLSLDGGDNGANCLSPNFLKISIQRGANISSLILDGNDLGGQLDRDENGSIFEDYKDLTELNLAGNNIKALYVDAFKNLKHLRILNLSSNSLRDIPFQFSQMQQLKYLDLSDNLLTDLSADICENLTNSFKFSNLTLNITGNPIQCSCQTLEFLMWLKENKQHVTNIMNIYCLFNKTRIYLDKLDDLIKSLSFQCESDLLLVVCGLLLAVVSIGVITSVCLYRHRWDIRYCLLNFRRSKHAYQRLIDQSRNYTHDAFVSYDHRDIKWIRNFLIPNIEQGHLTASSSPGTRPQKFRLCIHDRDFAAGEAIEKNVVHHIKASRKVLLILTQNFLKSRWCRFELEMSHLISFERGWNILVPIMLEPLPIDEMPSTLQLLIRRQTYITWTTQKPDFEEFWRRLRNVLSDTEERPCICECGRSFHEFNDEQSLQERASETYRITPSIL